MNISNDLRNIYTNALKEDKKIDSNSFSEIKKEILKDGKVSKEEREFVIDIIDNSEFKKGVAREAISFLDENPVKDEVKPETKTEAKTEIEGKKEPTTETKTEPEVATDATKDANGYPINWEGEGTLTGGINIASASNGNGEARGNLAYNKIIQKGHHKFDFNGLLDYGKTVNIDATGTKQTNISGDALNFDATYSYEMKPEPGKFNYAPYIKFASTGKVSDFQERSYRSSTGLQLTYTDEKRKSDFDLKLGLATENKYSSAETGHTLDSEKGFEMVFKGKQGLGFISPSNTYLNRMELATDINGVRLNSIDGHTGTNITSFFGGRLYMDDKQNTFVEVGKKYNLVGTQTETKKDSTTVFNVGFKY